MPIQYERIDGKALFEGDILLNIDEEGYARFGPTPSEEERRWRPTAKSAGRDDASMLWPGRTVFYSVESGIAKAHRIPYAIAHWEDKTGFQFVEDSSAPNRIHFRTGSGCSSDIGMQGGVQYIDLATSCSTGNTKHELGHAIGLFHEHTRADRDNYVSINWANIDTNYDYNFKQYSSGADYGDMDPGSIMMYSCTAFSSNGSNTIDPFDSSWCGQMGQRLSLSDGDVDGVMTMYPTREYATFDPPTSATAKKMTTSTEFGNNGMVSMTAVDADGDGVDEIAMLRSGLQLFLYENDGKTLVSLDAGNFVGSSEIVGGDFDGDGDEELGALKGNQLWVYNPVGGGQKWSLAAIWTVPFPVTELAAVDYDGDLVDEIVAYIGGSLFIYQAGGPMGLTLQGQGFAPSATDISGVDVDGDGFDEILYSKENAYVYVYDFGPGFTPVFVGSDAWGMPSLTGSTLLVAGYDDNGTGKIATLKE